MSLLRGRLMVGHGPLKPSILVRIQAPQQASVGERSGRSSSEGYNAKCSSKLSFMYYVYLIECGDKTLYTGITTDIQRRFKEHSLGQGGAYTRAKKVRRVLYTEQFGTRSDALKREAEIKSWHRKKKLDLIKK